MSKTKQTYKLGKIKQLVDLNRDITNFDLNFAVVSKDGSEFYAVVVDQTMLDNEPNPEYKKVNGKISGNILADKGIYQNYFLLLKADKPCECDVIIEIKEIPKNMEWEKQLINAEQAKRQSQLQVANMQKSDNETKGKNTMIIIALIAFFGVVLYFYFSKKTNETPVINDNVSVNSETRSVERSPSPSPTFYNSYKFSQNREPLFSKFR